VEEALRLIDGEYDAGYGDAVYGERSIQDMGDYDRKRIFEMAKKVAALELSNARLTNASMKRSKVEDGEKEDKLEALQKQVDANKAQIKQLQKMLAEIIQKVCKKKGDDCPKLPWAKKSTSVATEKPLETNKPAATKKPAVTEKPVATTVKLTTKKAPATEHVAKVTTAAPKPTASKAKATKKVETVKPVVTKAPTTKKAEVKTTPPPTTTAATKPPKKTAPKESTTSAPKTTTTKLATTTKKQPDPKGDCGKPDAPANGHTDSDKTTLNSEAKVICNPGYDLIGSAHQVCTAIWNQQNNAFDYVWAPPLSVICKPNGKPIPTAAPTQKPKPKPKPKVNPTEKPKEKTAAKATAKPTTKATSKPAAAKPAKEPAKKKPGKKELLERRVLLEEIEEIQKLIDESERDLEMKKKSWSPWQPDLSSVPARCKQRPEPDSCHYGWYFNRKEGRCDTVFSCLTEDGASNFFWSKESCYDNCESFLNTNNDQYDPERGWH